MLKIKFENTENKIEQPEIIEAALLSLEEAKSLMTIQQRKCSDYWWLRSKGLSSESAFGVTSSGNLPYNDDVNSNHLGVRPSLYIDNLKSIGMDISDKFKFGEYTFTIISNNLAICDEIIGKCQFNKKWSDGNKYETSYIKEYIDNWFNKTKQEEPDFLNKDNIDFMLQNNDNIELRAFLMDINHKLGFSGNRMDEIQKEIDDLFSDL